MMRFLIFTLTLFFIFSCSNNGEPVEYFEGIVGYKGNIASAKHGIIGTWKPVFPSGLKGYSEYRPNGEYCYRETIEDAWSCGTYKIVSKDGILHLVIGSKTPSSGEDREFRISILSKKELSIWPLNSGHAYLYKRISEAPIP